MAVPVGPRLTVSELIDRAEAQGCTLQITRAAILTAGDLRQVRYLYNPRNGGRYPLEDLDDDETLLGYEIALIARRLDIELP